MAINAEVYPITAQFEKDCERFRKGKAEALIVAALEAIGEYEHGSADVEDVFAESLGDRPTLENLPCLKAYAAVALDLVLLVNEI